MTCPNCGITHPHPARFMEPNDEQVDPRTLAWLVVSGLALWVLVGAALFAWLAQETAR